MQARTGALVLKGKLAVRAAVAQEFGAVLIGGRVAEVANEKIQVTIVVQVAPGGADGVAPCAQSAIARGFRCSGNLGKGSLSIITPKAIGEEAVVGNVDIRVAIAIIVSSSDAARSHVAHLGKGVHRPVFAL